ncbi:hypothetical protein C882_1733 [Caenispirillum salinarum AK4]|uniref:ABM domain-containing protein n=1 Tax=Caenispirillum salinarum AK4 TaxID=1238182 RepID=K9H3N4_9PROT|nr:antibiotic biosynthesis monooxygenase [Caenispirillum salinarum]EKV32895.1 hypothetical protein C882_1733 [Caenispirillum salinarum AK4]
MDDRTPGCYAVIFTSRRTEAPDDGYETMADRMVALARAQPGFLGVESARGPDGFGITVSYWESEEAIRAWKHHAEHVVAREGGRAGWYSAYITRVARLERAYAMGDPAKAPETATEDT